MQKIYKRNHSETKVINADIKETEIDIEDMDILDGSPPCITFSVARAKKRDSKIQESDTENLIMDYIRVVSKCKPKVCIIENVKEFLYAPVFNKAMKELSSSGYDVNYKILNSVDYEVAQIRLRLFIIAVRKDISNKVRLTEDDILKIFPKKKSCLYFALYTLPIIK